MREIWQQIKCPDVVKQYHSIQDFIKKNEDYINKIITAQIDADYKGDYERKRELLHIEANMQEVVNLMYEVVSFIESKWFE